VRHFSDKPRIVAGNLRTPQETSLYLSEGHAEAAALARALITDAQWVHKARRGEAETIRPYEEAHWGAINQGVDPGAHVQGAIQEDDLDEDP
jgi:2,4-dienoyl-CoA reductase-like NADH-dependent reductase (Old Yellow Enzyme family)